MMAQATAETRKSRLLVKSRELAVGLTLIGLALRLVNLGQYSFWFDEAMEILRALTPWPDILLVSDGADPPLLRLLISPIAKVTLGEFWLRLPAAVFGAGSIYLAYEWLAQLGQPKLGLVTASLLALAPVEIFYSQEVSQYTLSVFLALAVLIAFDQAAKLGRWRDWLFLWSTTVVALYTYYGLAWLLPSLDLYLLQQTWRKRARHRVTGFLGFHIGLTAAIGLLYRLTLATQYERFAGRKLSASVERLGIAGWMRTLDDQLYRRFLRFFTIPWSDSAPDLIPILFGLLALIGAVVLWLRVRKGRMLLYVASSTLALLCIADGLGVYPFGWRYALFLSPFYFLLIASAIRWLDRWRPAAVVAAGLVFLVFLFFSPNLQFVSNPWMNVPREDLRPAIEYVERRAQPGDLIYVYYGAKPAYRVYQREDMFSTRMGIWFRDWTTDRKADSIRQAVGDEACFWFVLSHIYLQEDRAIIQGLAQTPPSYRVLEEFRAEDAAAIFLCRD